MIHGSMYNSPQPSHPSHESQPRHPTLMGPHELQPIGPRQMPVQPVDTSAMRAKMPSASLLAVYMSVILKTKGEVFRIVIVSPIRKVDSFSAIVNSLQSVKLEQSRHRRSWLAATWCKPPCRDGQNSAFQPSFSRHQSNEAIASYGWITDRCLCDGQVQQHFQVVARTTSKSTRWVRVSSAIHGPGSNLGV